MELDQEGTAAVIQVMSATIKEQQEVIQAQNQHIRVLTESQKTQTNGDEVAASRLAQIRRAERDVDAAVGIPRA